MTDTAYDAILVVSFGGPEGPDDVVPFLENVTRGRGIPRERLVEVGAHYALFGGVSPINAQCRALLDALGPELRDAGIDLPVYWGNRNWHPMLADTLQQMRDDGVRRALAFVTSAWSSYSSCRQYLDDIDRARATVGDDAPEVDKIRQFFDHPGFVEPLADNVRAALAAAGADPADPQLRVLFSAHSIPVSMAAGCDYEAQLGEAARLVAERAGVPAFELVYQSRSGPPQMPWLEPDVGDRIEALAADGVTTVVVVPVGFVSDHMEVVYDLDTQAAERAEACGVRLVRVATVGTDPRFVAMVRELLQERLDPARPRRALGGLGVRPDRCAPGCCPAPARPPASGTRPAGARP
jgi:ferrochelatase